MGPRNAVLGVRMAEAEDGRMGGGRRGQREEETEERGALSLQNEDPTPQDGWEKQALTRGILQGGFSGAISLGPHK